MNQIKRFVKEIPVIGPLLQRGYRRLAPTSSFDSTTYWQNRYRQGGNSGLGSYGILAQHKADVLNQFIESHNVESVIEFGCGDGNQASLGRYPRYIGFDISPDAIALCRSRFVEDQTKLFKLVDEYAGEKAELVLSLDVIYHLVEDETYINYMQRLFASAQRFVAIYSTNEEQLTNESVHIRHRRFTDWIAKNALDWQLIEHVPNPHTYRSNLESRSAAEFFIFEKVS